MILTKRQEEGLKIAVERHRANEKYTVIAGYAGTGKSTLVRYIIKALDVEENRVCYCAFTGKAAEVLRKKEIKMFVLFINYYMNISRGRRVAFLENQNHLLIMILL